MRGPALRPRCGPACLSRRLPALGAGMLALDAIAVWPAVFAGALALPAALSASAWHAREMLLGFGGRWWLAFH